MNAVMFHQGALGDFLLALSALEGWCATRPGVRVDFWSKREHVSLLAGKEYLGDFHSLDGLLIASLLDDDLWKTTALPEFLLRADHVFIFGQEGTRVMAQRLSARTGARVDWLRSFPPPDHSGAHVLDFIHRQLEELAPPCRRVYELARLSHPPSEISAAKDLLEGLGMRGDGPGPILIHPGSGGAKKVWPLRNWRNILHWIRSDLRVPVILSVGPADERVEEFCREMSGVGRPVVSGLSLAGLSALLSLCRAFVGSDSGVSHLAAAAGTPSVVIFGPTDPDVWGPRGENVHTVRKNWVESEIFEWAEKDLPGQPDTEVIKKIRTLL